MDRHNWEENYFEWTGDLLPLLWTTVKSVPVCSPYIRRNILSCANLHKWADMSLWKFSFFNCLSVTYLAFLFSPYLLGWWWVVGFCFRYTTSPHLFTGDAEVAFARVRSKVCPVIVGIVSTCLVLLLLFSFTWELKLRLTRLFLAESLYSPYLMVL